MEKEITVSRSGFQVVAGGFNLDGTVRPQGVRIVCSCCGSSQVMTTPSQAASNASEWIEKRFAQKGWRVASRRDADICPSCLAKRDKKPVVNEEKKPMLAVVEETKKPDLKTILEKREPAVLSLRDKIAIIDLMKPFVKQDGELCEYLQGMSDKKIAALTKEKLNLSPSDWVIHSIRVDFFGKLKPKQKFVPTGGSAHNAFSRAFAQINELQNRVNELEELYLRLTTK